MSPAPSPSGDPAATGSDPAGPLSDARLAAELCRLGVAADGSQLVIVPLSGGVSNDVLAVSGPGVDVVVKQALPRLRVAEEWLAAPGRVVTEAKALQTAGRIRPGHVPRVIAVDPRWHLAVIERAPRHFAQWRGQLLSGRIEVGIADDLGELLADWHVNTVDDPLVDAEFADVEAFIQLRVDPFYRWVAARHPDIAARISKVADQMLSTRRCLVHGDFSPKNVLVADGGLWVIDWEVAHIGDPVFDVAFLITHLACKTLHRPADGPAFHAAAAAFMASYNQASAPALGELDPGYLARQVGCLLLARMDGKSPATYLSAPQRARGRALAREVLLADDNQRWGDLWAHLP